MYRCSAYGRGRVARERAARLLRGLPHVATIKTQTVRHPCVRRPSPCISAISGATASPGRGQGEAYSAPRPTMPISSCSVNAAKVSGAYILVNHLGSR